MSITITIIRQPDKHRSTSIMLTHLCKLDQIEPAFDISKIDLKEMFYLKEKNT